VQILLFFVGLVLLVVGAELLVKGGSSLAVSVGISPLVVGLTVVAFGTSAPEMAVSVGSAIDGKADLALGNVVGSNVFNILFILGLCALLAPLVVQSQLVRIDVPIMIFVSVLVFVLALDDTLGRIDGAILFGGIIAYTVFLIRKSRSETKAVQDEFAEEYGEDVDPPRPMIVNIGLLLAGLVMLVGGSQLLLQAAVDFAESLGVSELVIGLTLVAMGTSLPEVATSVMATIRGERDIAIGNVVGSNLFNLLGALGLTALVAPDGIPVSASSQTFDLPVMIAVAVACLPIFFSGYAIARWEGGVFFAYYVAFTAYLVLRAQEAEALDTYATVMLFFVVPLTVLTLVVTAVQAWREHGLHGPHGTDGSGPDAGGSPDALTAPG
jgi:cation:H+ antiporter